MVALGRPEYDYLTLWGVGRLLHTSGPELARVINRPDFPQQSDPGYWRKAEVEAWYAQPRCTHGGEHNPCWEERDEEDKYQLGMCEKHSRQAEQTMREQRIARMGRAY